MTGSDVEDTKSSKDDGPTGTSSNTYHLGIDAGTTFTAAAVVRDGRVSMVSLGDNSPTIPSVIFLKTDGSILTGHPARRRGVNQPERMASQFKRRIGDTTPLLLGGTPYSAEALTAKLLRWVVDGVTRREGGPPSSIALTHPANWGAYKLDVLRNAIEQADLVIDVLLTEPEAAAVYYASQERVDDDSVIAVYDLGGGTFDAAVLRKISGGWEVLGTPEGIEHLGGVDIDEAVFHHVRQAIGAEDAADLDAPETQPALALLRQEFVDAKEALSSDTDVTISVLLPGFNGEVRLTRGELETFIAPTLRDTTVAMHRALRSVPIDASDITSVLLVGGSSRIPLVSELVSEEFGRPVAVDAHPKHAVALGAAIATSSTSDVPPTDDGELPSRESTPARVPEERRQFPRRRLVVAMGSLVLLVAAVILGATLLPGPGPEPERTIADTTETSDPDETREPADGDDTSEDTGPVTPTLPTVIAAYTFREGPFDQFNPNPNRLSLLLEDGSSVVVEADNDAGGVGGLTVSPDGRHIAATSADTVAVASTTDPDDQRTEFISADEFEFLANGNLVFLDGFTLRVFDIDTLRASNAVPLSPAVDAVEEARGEMNPNLTRIHRLLAVGQDTAYVAIDVKEQDGHGVVEVNLGTGEATFITFLPSSIKAVSDLSSDLRHLVVGDHAGPFAGECSEPIELWLIDLESAEPRAVEATAPNPEGTIAELRRLEFDGDEFVLEWNEHSGCAADDGPRPVNLGPRHTRVAIDQVRSGEVTLADEGDRIYATADDRELVLQADPEGGNLWLGAVNDGTLVSDTVVDVAVVPLIGGS